MVARWLSVAGWIAVAVSGAPLEGVFTDPRHAKPVYGCGGSACESIEGTRIVYTDPANGRITMLGADNDGVVWSVLGRMADGGSGGLSVDFSLREPELGILDGAFDGASLTWADEAHKPWRKVTDIPRLEYDADADIQFDGVYADPDVWTGGLPGLRFVSHRVGKVDGISITAVGTDDGVSTFRVHGAFRIENSFFMDFTPIGGVKGWDGIVIKGALLWPDGTKWVKLRGMDPKDEL